MVVMSLAAILHHFLKGWTECGGRISYPDYIRVTISGKPRLQNRLLIALVGSVLNVDVTRPRKV